MNYVSNYQLYLISGHWQQFVRKNIAFNKKAKCWICGSKRYLQGHHNNYNHLYEEKLGKDVTILCKRHHRAVHFVLWFWKLPTLPWLLNLRRHYLRVQFQLIRI